MFVAAFILSSLVPIQSGSAVGSAVPVASVRISPTSVKVIVGKRVPLTATIRDASGAVLTGRVISWRSNDISVATVTENGLVTGVGAGFATITATSEGRSDRVAVAVAAVGTATVTVTPPSVASISMIPASAIVMRGRTVQLTPTPRDVNGTALTGRVVTWGSSNSGVAIVSATGLVTGVAAGSATVIATSEGRAGGAAITVTAGAGEPLFIPAVDVSLFYDDFESYNTTSDLTTGGTAKYRLSVGSVSLVNSAGNDFAGGAKFTRFDYNVPGTYANELYTTLHHSPLLNTAATVVLTYGFRNTGAWYDGNEFTIRNTVGDQRFVLTSFANLIQPPSLQNCWYTNTYPFNPLFSSVPPLGTTPTWRRESVSGPTPSFLGGTMGYPAANLRTNNDGIWHRFTYRFTNEKAGFAMGRVEGWYDGVKFMEYMGDDLARCERGQVWTWSGANAIWDGDLYFFGTTNGGWAGGALLDMDGVRLWIP